MKDLLPEEAWPPETGRHGEYGYTKQIVCGSRKIAKIEILLKGNGCFRVCFPVIKNPTIPFGDDDNVQKAWDLAKD